METSLEEALKEERKKIRKEVRAEYEGKLRKLKETINDNNGRMNDLRSEIEANKIVVERMTVSAMFVDALFILKGDYMPSKSQRLQYLKSLGFSGIEIEMLTVPGGEGEEK